MPVVVGGASRLPFLKRICFAPPLFRLLYEYAGNTGNVTPPPQRKGRPNVGV